tara:strand:+ start:130 stop:639 length:510 start_codon:yes stop_codon:yes gene_type:complete
MSRVVVNEIEAKVGNDITFNDTIKIDTLKGKTTAGSITVHGEGTATTNLQGGLAKMVINYDQQANSIRSSLNVSSVSDNSTGDFTITFTASKTDINYSPSSASLAYATSDRIGNFVGIRTTSGSTPNARTNGLATSTLRINSGYAASASGAGSEADADVNGVQTFGDLA